MRDADVHVVGSVNVDLVVTAPALPGPGETVGDGRFERHGGGKSANQAVAAARRGARVRMVAAVGDDDLGDEAVGLLEAEGIDVSAVRRLEGSATGVALIVVDDAGENQIAVAPGANAALDAAWVERSLRGAAGGAVLLALEVPDAAVLAAARAAREGGLGLVLNPAPARDLPEELLALSPVLTPNRAEARALTGEDAPEAAARALARRTQAPVVVTLGREGALLVEGDALERVSAPSVRAVDTTGAGDAFNGVLAHELARGAALLDAVRTAVEVAAESTRAAGARSVARTGAG
jgi:ribokinase